MQGEIVKEQSRLKRECNTSVARQLDHGREFFLTLFPKATIRAGFEDASKSAAARDYLDFRINQIQNVIRSLLDAAMSADSLAELQSVNMAGFQLTTDLSDQLIRTLVEIFTCGRNLQESDFIFLGEVSAELNILPGQVHYLIDQVQFETRKAFFSAMLVHLNEDQRDLCAILLLKAIEADDKVHPAEFKYFENISQLLEHDQARLEHVGVSTGTFDFNTSIEIPDEISAYLFEYLIEIVMCDRKYDPKESRFIQDVAGIFGFDKQRQDEIIQPAAAALMIKAELFQ